MKATARLATPNDPVYAQVQQRIRAKYGFMTKITKVLNTIGGAVKRNRIPYGDRAVVITIAD